MIPPRPTELAHLILRQCIRPGDHVIDATAGNGHDTLFLAEQVGEHGKVMAFDIQPRAIESARLRIEQAGLAPRVEFHLGCHSEMDSHAPAESVSAVMFNLGYLPGDDHEITTGTEKTLKALARAASLLRHNGVLSVVCYPGHDGGDKESAAVEEHLIHQASLGWRLAKYTLPGTRKTPPFLLIACKIANNSDYSRESA